MSNEKSISEWVELISSTATTISLSTLAIRVRLDKIKDLICDCYCKFPEEYRAMYKDIDEADENLDREKCSMCPLMNL